MQGVASAVRDAGDQADAPVLHRAGDPAHACGVSAAAAALVSNRELYDGLWSAARLVPPQRWSTWPTLAALAGHARAALEIGPGVHPRLPLERTRFVDVSVAAVARLRAAGASAIAGDLAHLPFPDAAFDLVCACDVVEHVAGDGLHELARVTADGGTVVFSVPLHAPRWNVFDEFAGHVRRYDPDELAALLDGAALTVAQSAPFGMAPRNPWLLRFGIWALTHRRVQALRWYNWILPLVLLRRRPLVWSRGLLDADGLQEVDEAVFVCRRRARSARSAARGAEA